MKNIFLEGENINLRILQNSDCNEDYLQWLNDQSNDLYTGHAIWPNTIDSMTKFVKKMNISRNDLFLGIIRKDNESHIGNIGVHNISWINKSAEIKILVGKKDSQISGFGKEAINLIVKHSFTKLNLHRLELGVHCKNERAIRAYKSCGFLEEGVFKDAICRNGIFWDVIRMSILNNK